MDYLDITNPRTRFTAAARYYPDPVDGPNDGGVRITYEYVNPYSNTYRRLFANIQGAAGELAIRTATRLDYRVNGIIILADGRAFKILQVEKDYQSAAKQALRLFPTPVSTTYVIRMVSVPNPWGVT